MEDAGSRSDLERQAQSLFERALDVCEDERNAFLEEADASPEVREIARDLLDRDREPEPFLEPIAEAHDVRLDGETPTLPGFGQRYRAVAEIGSGGTSRVYLGERIDEEYRQQVAIKVLRRELLADLDVDREDLQRRFRIEKQVLASLQHPTIARLLDAGETDDGLPFLVMEYIHGEPLTSYCDQERWSIDQRLHLFLEVCDAVRHAHAQLIIHRDLKPGNILVDAEGHAKLLDFGIAKILSPVSGAARTGPEQKILTPEYASPEHLAGERMTTSSDVYSLGVLLFELSTGRKPWGSSDVPWPVRLELLRSSTPPRPSSLWQSSSEESEEEVGYRAEVRQDSIPALRHRLQGDLDAIILHALEADPARRYRSVEEMAEDICRHLEGLPIRARPATRRYRWGKFLRRHRVAVTNSLLLTLLVVGATAALWKQSHRLAQERDEANRQRQRAERVVSFLAESIRPDPQALQGEDTTVQSLLEHRAERIDNELGQEPDLRAHLHGVVGGAFLNLGLADQARESLDRAMAIQDEVGWSGTGNEAHILTEVARLRIAEGRLDEAREAASKALGTVRKLHGEDSAEAGAATRQLAEIEAKAGKLQPALELALQALAIHRAGAAEDAHLATDLATLAHVHFYREDYESALTVGREALDAARALYEESHPIVLERASDMAVILYEAGRFDESLEAHRTVLEGQRKYHGDVHPATAASLNNLGALCNEMGLYDEAEVTLAESLGVMRQIWGEEHPEVGNTRAVLAGVQRNRGATEKAERSYRGALRAIGQALGEDHPRYAFVELNLAGLLVELHRFDEARQLARRALESTTQRFGETHERVASARMTLADITKRQGDSPTAEAMISESVQQLTETYGEGDWRLAPHLAQHGDVLTDLGRYEEAADSAWRAIELYSEKFPPSHRRIAFVESILGLALAGCSDCAAVRQAAPDPVVLLERSLERLREAYGDTGIATRDATRRLAEFRSGRLPPEASTEAI
ncbi:MAG: tetratricopeptide repeat protein [Thermoanaerobaculia bacterium]|nr:tetratricopeptide repeat protein [Thermoanaerobaculia bacterium]